MSTSPRPANPSWIKVIGTTLRLWLRRRVLRVPDSRDVSAVRRVSLVAIVLVIAAAIVAGALALAAAPSRPAATAPARHRPVRPAVTQQELQTEANITAASAWITAEVSPQAWIACDPYTGGQLVADGFPPGQEDVLQPGGALPAVPAGQPGGPGATLVVATQTLTSQYGPALDAAAPVVLASFGTGPAGVQVRLAVPGGAAAAQQDAAAALAARRTAGRALAKFRHAHLHAAAKQELTAGQVDPRLATVLRRLSAARPVTVISFSGPPGPAALTGQPSPLRLAQVGGLVHKQGRREVSELKAVLKLLKSQRAPYLPQLKVTRLAGGRIVLSIWFPAPSPY